jgi:uncharacterized damage-inducible protein DinB
MTEGPEAYVDRISSYVGKRSPLQILRSTPRALEKRISGVTRRRLSTPPERGKWSVGQILAHLSEVELLWGYRIRTILERDGATIAGMDQDAWARNSHYERIDPRHSLELFQALRRANLELLQGLSPRALGRHGKHSAFGRLTVSWIARLLAGHDINHTRQIGALLKEGTSRGRD